MPIEFERLRGYVPTEKELYKSLRISSMDEIRSALLDRCRLLFSKAEEKGKIENFGTSHNFIICKSTDFFSIFSKMGYGSSAMIIKDDYGPGVYFMIFEDKAPKEFYPILAAHECIEYDLFLEGVDQGEAHKTALFSEIEMAKKMRLKTKYINYLKEKYPEKEKEMRSLNIY